MMAIDVVVYFLVVQPLIALGLIQLAPTKYILAMLGDRLPSEENLIEKLCPNGGSPIAYGEFDWWQFQLSSSGDSQWSEPFLSYERGKNAILTHYSAGTISQRMATQLLAELEDLPLLEAACPIEHELFRYEQACPPAAYVRYVVLGDELFAEYVLDGLHGPKRVFGTQPLCLSA